MQYRKMKSTGDELSILGFGCMRLPEKNNRIDEERAKKMIHRAIDKGVNYFDTGYFYHMGQSEPFLGKVISPDIRKQIKLATKLPPASVNQSKDMEIVLNNQLEWLRTDHIDYYLLHGIDQTSWNKFLNLGALEFLEKAKKQGKIDHIGFSYHGDLSSFKKIIDHYPWEFCQIQYNYFDQKIQVGTEGLEYAAAKDIGIIIMEPLRGGLLTKTIPGSVQKLWDGAEMQRSPAEWALKWIWNRADVNVVLSGMTEEIHVEENLRFASEAKAGSFSLEELDIVENVRQEYQKAMKIPCTGCNYCMPCPAKVNIPMCFELFNRIESFGEGKFHNLLRYASHLGAWEKGQRAFASQCISCGKCVKKCPQKIDIPKELQKVKKLFETFFFGFFVVFSRIFMQRIGSKSKRKKNQN